eukprot:TRINITY_DN1204_c0_g1_i1.p1 TRINITY_DN1204_c0_g1~~TRINITY_DN1204_c0_g1_i1.p1  ORF type:complete len:106 (-),score=42.04 TRINITY_DN1204_c0_g1_i1:142-459(-)
MSTEVAEKLFPSVKAEDDEDEEESPAEGGGGDKEEEEEEELVDPAVAIKSDCQSGPCASYLALLESCTDRVSSKSKTSETCMEEMMDLYHCVDHCTSPQVLKLCK